MAIGEVVGIVVKTLSGVGKALDKRPLCIERLDDTQPRKSFFYQGKEETLLGLYPSRMLLKSLTHTRNGQPCYRYKDKDKDCELQANPTHDDYSENNCKWFFYNKFQYTQIGSLKLIDIGGDTGDDISFAFFREIRNG